MTLESPNTPPSSWARFTLNAGFNPVVLGRLRLKETTPHFLGVQFTSNAPLPRNSGADCFGHNPRRWRKPPFRLLCQVARAVARSQQLRFIRRLLSLDFWQCRV
ncbi:hypothetical protein [Nostoc sp. DSM 114167]|uniref:hypothetical protein n=1 Tax=Nostoc sp. DSM 114167 TaxID=3439050 RepID=UPI004046295D